MGMKVTAASTTSPWGKIEPAISKIRVRSSRLVSALHGYKEQKGLRSTALAVLRTLVQPLVRFNHHFIWEAELTERIPSVWSDEESFSIIGPEDLDAKLTPKLLKFLGGERAADDLNGVRQGDRLLLVTIAGDYVYSGYIYFNTTRETLRQKKIYNESDETPVIGTCISTPSKIWAGKAESIRPATELASRLQKLLPTGMALEKAASGFKNLGQFVYTVYLSHNLEIPFDQLKAKVLGGSALWKAVQELRPGVDATTEVRRAWDEASIHRRVLNDVFRYLYSQGYRRAMNDVLAHNEASHKANAAVGMKIRRELQDWTILKRCMLQRARSAGRSSWRLFGI
jgi:hypothetical protein